MILILTIRAGTAQSPIQTETFLDSINKSDLLLLNPDTVTHINSSNCKTSNIDLVFSTSDIADTLHINANDDTWGSDHFPVFIDLITQKSIYHKKSLNLKSIRTNWDKVYDQLNDNYNELLTSKFQNLNAAMKYQFFTNIISKAIIENTPKKKIVTNSEHRNPVSWWDAECDRVKRWVHSKYNPLY